MATNAVAFPFEKLKGRENFDIWKRHAKSYFVIKNCWKVVENELPAEPSGKEKDSDERALAELTLMIEPNNFSHIATATTAHQAWKALFSAYEDTGLTRKVELSKQLVQCKLSDYVSVQEYVNSLVMTSLKVQNAGLNIDEELTASLMLAGLPDVFRPLVLAVENTKDKLTIDGVKTLLLQDVKFDNTNMYKCGENALYSKSRTNLKEKSNQFRCHSSKQLGNFARNCPNETKRDGNNTKSKSVLFASLLSHDIRKDEWCVESGATFHMTRNYNVIVDQVPVANKNILVANNKTIKVKSKGDVNMSIYANEIKTDAVVKDVEYVPELCANLLSVRQMTKNGNKVIFDGNECKIYNNKRNLISTANAVNDLYRLKCVTKYNSESKCILYSR